MNSKREKAREHRNAEYRARVKKLDGEISGVSRKISNREARLNRLKNPRRIASTKGSITKLQKKLKVLKSQRTKLKSKIEKPVYLKGKDGRRIRCFVCKQPFELGQADWRTSDNPAVVFRPDALHKRQRHAHSHCLAQ